MSVAVLNKTKVIYSIIATCENIDGIRREVYGLEGVDGIRKTVIPALSRDKERIISLVDNLNEAQFDLQKLNKLIFDNIAEVK